jgi:diacylglycerol kinase family enzyme
MPRWACTRCGAGEVLFASALNTPTYGSGMPLAPMARVDDGRLEVLRAAAMGLSALAIAFGLALGI